MDNQEARSGKKREWIKNIAIIFLVVLLILTLFSNTIMNRNLPEVTTQYVMSGTISPRIRGTGTVTANSAYEVKIRENRVIQTVAVRRGDTVEVGDVLFILKEGESADTTELREKLETARYDYRVMLLETPYVNYTTDNRNIQRLREALEDAIAERDEGYVTDEQVRVAQNGVSDREIIAEKAADDLERIDEEIAEINEQITALGGTTGGEGEIADNYDLYQAVNKADIDRRTAYIRYAKEMLDLYQKTFSFYIDGGDSTSRYYQQYADLYRLITDEVYQNSGTAQDPQVQYDWLFNLFNSENEIAFYPYCGISTKYFYNWFNNDEIAHLQAYAQENAEANPEYLTALTTIQTAESTYTTALKALNDANAAAAEQMMEGIQASQNAAQLAALKEQLAGLNNEKKGLEKVKKHADEDLAEAQEILKTLTDRQANYKTLDNAVKTAEDALESAIVALQNTQHSNGVTRQEYDMKLEQAKKNIEEMEAKLEETGSEEQGNTINAPVAGTVTAINISAGSTTEYDVSLMTIEESDRGYMCSIPVSNEQAQRVKLGDKAEMSGYYWGPEINATLAAITNDPSNPGQGKLLNFTIEGEVKAGDQLNLAIGERSQNYELVVPKNAVRTDSNGSYVLMVTSKSSPLGNRYVASRVDVQIVASDDVNHAITGALSNYDFVITNASAPVDPGQLVRLAAN